MFLGGTLAALLGLAAVVLWWAAPAAPRAIVQGVTDPDDLDTYTVVQMYALWQHLRRGIDPPEMQSAMKAYREQSAERRRWIGLAAGGAVAGLALLAAAPWLAPKSRPRR